MNRVLVIGGNSAVGRQVIGQLPAAGAEVRALVRNPASADLPPSVEVVAGDLTAPESLDGGLRGIDAVFLIWTASPATVAPVVERIAQRARRIVFLSSPYKTPHPLFQAAQPNPVSALHAEIERQIQDSGMQWTFLRPGMFAANAGPWWAAQIRTGDVVRWPYPDAPTAPTHEHDIAAVAVRSLSEDRHAGAEYMITGPESMTQAEQIHTIGRVVGRSLRVDAMSPDETRREWANTWPASATNMLLAAWAGALGQPALVTSTVAEVTGLPARTFLDWTNENAAKFQS